MKLVSRFILLFGFSMVVIAPITAYAQAALPASASANTVATKHKKSDRIEGIVTAIDPVAGTVTIHNRKLNTDVVATVTKATKYMFSRNIGVAGLNIGDRIDAQSKDKLTSGATNVAADRINVLSPLTEPKKHQNPRTMEGTVASLSPTLTITTDDGSTVSITTNLDTKVMALQPAELANVTVGQRVQAMGKLNSGTYVAIEIHIMPAENRKAGRRKL
jgi:hypothetical protein